MKTDEEKFKRELAESMMNRENNGIIDQDLLKAQINAEDHTVDVAQGYLKTAKDITTSISNVAYGR